jgi:hypothetical protein
VLILDNLVEQHGDNIRLTPCGKLFADEVSAQFVSPASDHLERE